MGQANIKSAKLNDNDIFERFKKANKSERNILLLKYKDINLNQQLQFAVRANDLALAEFFITHGAAVVGNVDKTYELPILFFCQCAEMADLLMAEDKKNAMLSIGRKMLNRHVSPSSAFLVDHPNNLSNIFKSSAFNQIDSLAKEIFIKSIFLLALKNLNFTACRIILDLFPQLHLNEIKVEEIDTCLADGTYFKEHFLLIRQALDFNFQLPNKPKNTALAYLLNDPRVNPTQIPQLLQYALLINPEKLIKFFESSRTSVVALENKKFEIPFLLAITDSKLEVQLQQYINAKFIFLGDYKIKDIDGYDLILESLDSQQSESQEVIKINVAILHGFIRHYKTATQGFTLLPTQYEDTYQKIYREMIQQYNLIKHHPNANNISPSANYLMPELLDIESSPMIKNQGLFFTQKQNNTSTVPTAFRDLVIKHSI